MYSPFFVLNLGQNLPLRIAGHSMVPLGIGQAILGGRDPSFNGAYYSAIYHMKCSQHICEVVQLDKSLSLPRAVFVVIPIPDSMAQCISESKLASLSYRALFYTRTDCLDIGDWQN